MLPLCKQHIKKSPSECTKRFQLTQDQRAPKKQQNEQTLKGRQVTVQSQRMCSERAICNNCSSICVRIVRTVVLTQSHKGTKPNQKRLGQLAATPSKAMPSV